MMKDPKFLYGLMHFEDGVRPVLMKRGTKYFTAVCMDSRTLYKRFVLFKEIKFFKERANSNDDHKEIKRVARFLKLKSKLTGLSKEMPKLIKNLLTEAIAYENN